jgi:hypothetical protein
MLPERRRAPSYIHSDIENSPFHNGDQLGLSGGRELEMQSAQRARTLGSRLVVLDETAGDASVAKSLLMKGLHKPTAVINVAFPEDNARNVHVLADHSEATAQVAAVRIL